jgi:hypothetical protein
MKQEKYLAHTRRDRGRDRGRFARDGNNVLLLSGRRSAPPRCRCSTTCGRNNAWLLSERSEELLELQVKGRGHTRGTPCAHIALRAWETLLRCPDLCGTTICVDHPVEQCAPLLVEPAGDVGWRRPDVPGRIALEIPVQRHEQAPHNVHPDVIARLQTNAISFLRTTPSKSVALAAPRPST